MKPFSIATLVLTIVAAGQLETASAHCEVPCGIYDDQRQFEHMLEDTKTIAKAIDQINELVEDMAEDADPLGVNQIVRWVNNKESHATNTQHIIAQYFMSQRIKPDEEGYSEKLTAAHAVMVAAMKCKQDADPETADVLRKTILDFYRAYEGKEPVLHDHE